MTQCIMALDQGTTSSRTILFSETGDILSSASAPLPCYFPQSGWVEQKPEEIWESQKRTILEALEKAKLTMKEVTAIGITNQRETVIAWNRDTGEPLGNAIVWQCRRTADFCEELKKEGFDRVLKEKTGLVTDPYFSGTKMRWILKNRKEAEDCLSAQKLIFGTVDSWLIYKLTGGKKHVTDISNASRTLVYNIHSQSWDNEILTRFSIPPETLPTVVNSSGIVGHCDASLFGASVPIAGIAGDQQASLFGQTCFEVGMAKNTYGTGCFMLMNTGDKAVTSEHGLLTTIAWRIGEKTTYALEGSVFIAGALVQWIRDNLGLVEDASQTEAMAQSVNDNGGLYIVPAFVGLGAPHWNPHARGMMVGLTRDTNRNHIARASLEAICYQTYEVLKAMESDTGEKLKSLRVDGGAANNNFLCQFQADIINLTLSRPAIVETTAMGAAFLAGLAVGIWKSPAEIVSLWKEQRSFSPQMPENKVTSYLEEWNRAVASTQFWSK